MSKQECLVVGESTRLKERERFWGELNKEAIQECGD